MYFKNWYEKLDNEMKIKADGIIEKAKKISPDGKDEEIYSVAYGELEENLFFASLKCSFLQRKVPKTLVRIFTVAFVPLLSLVESSHLRTIQYAHGEPSDPRVLRLAWYHQK